MVITVLLATDGQIAGRLVYFFVRTKSTVTSARDAAPATGRLAILGAQIFLDRLRGPASRTHGQNYRCSAGNNITAGEYALPRGFLRLRVGHDVAALVGFESRCR